MVSARLSPPGPSFSKGGFYESTALDDLEQTLREDPALTGLALEFVMARKALDLEYRRNIELVSLSFCSTMSCATTKGQPSLSCATTKGSSVWSRQDTNLSALSAQAPIHDVQDSKPLWAYPPCGVQKPSCVAAIVGHTIADEALKLEVASYLTSHGIEASFWHATGFEEERRLASTIPHRHICILGDRGALRQVVAGIMDRHDQEDVVLGILPSESLCMSTTDEMGIRTLKDGMDKLVAGQVRAMDLLKFEDLTQTTQTRAIYAMSNVDWGCTVAAVANSKQMSKVFGSSARTIAIVGGVLKNASYPAAIEIPQSEAPSEYVNLLAQERDYHCINVYHSKTIIMGSQSIRVNASAQLDDGLMELMVKRFGSRGDFSKSMKRMVLTGEQTSAYATEDSWNSMVQVSSVIVRPASSGTGKCHMGSNSVIVDRDIVGGSPYRISVAPRALKLFV